MNEIIVMSIVVGIAYLAAMCVGAFIAQTLEGNKYLKLAMVIFWPVTVIVLLIAFVFLTLSDILKEK